MNSEQRHEAVAGRAPGSGPGPAVGAIGILLGLLAIDLVIYLGHVALAEHPYLGALVDLDKEANLPTWYSSMKLALAAAAAVYCYCAEAAWGNAERPRLRAAWLLVAAFMLALSADETSQIHETMTDWLMTSPAGENFRAAFGASEASDSMLWVIVFSPLMVLAATALVLFYVQRFKASRWLIAGGLGAVLLLAASAFLETREAAIAGTQGLLTEERWQLYLAYVTLEEMAEQVAITLLVSVHYAYATGRVAPPPAGRAGVVGGPPAESRG